MKFVAARRDYNKKLCGWNFFLVDKYEDRTGNAAYGSHYLSIFWPTVPGLTAAGFNIGTFPWFTLLIRPTFSVLIRFRRWDGTPVFKNHF